MSSKIKNCGIYKITSTSGRVYIGESKDIQRRWNTHKSFLNCSNQRKLYNSFKKYGVENHIFEIIEECLFENLKCRERYWQDFYNVLNKGLNCKLTECGEQKQIHSLETIEKIRIANTGRKVSEETKAKLREINLGENSTWYGKAHTEETKRKIGEAQVGYKNHMARLVLNIETGIFYETAKEAAKSCEMNVSTFNTYITGKRKNKSINYIYV